MAEESDAEDRRHVRRVLTQRAQRTGFRHVLHNGLLEKRYPQAVEDVIRLRGSAKPVGGDDDAS